MASRPRWRWSARLLVVAGLALAVLAPATAWAQGTNDDYPPSTVTTTQECGGSGTRPAVCGTSVVRGASTSSTLPFTGGDVALLTVLGLVAAGGGLVLVSLGRRRSSAAA